MKDFPHGAFQDAHTPSARVHASLQSPKNSKPSRYQRKLQSSKTFMELIKKSPMSDAVIDEVRHRQIRVGDKWLTDFASCNYLGFDVDPEIQASVADHIPELTTYPGQSRLLGSPYLYQELEKRICELIEAPDCIIMPTITLTHIYALPFLAEEGDLFLDKRAHKTIYDGCVCACHYGATLHSFRHNDPNDLEEQLKKSTKKRKLICIDGVYSMHGDFPPIDDFMALAEKYDAYLYLDDAHAFGILGERDKYELSPYGKKGNGTIKHFGYNYDRVIYIGGLSKSYSNLVGFITCPPTLKKEMKIAFDPYLYSGPAPIPVLSMLLKSFEVNQTRGDLYRAHLYNLSRKTADALADMNIHTLNDNNFPIFHVAIERYEDIHFIGQYLYDQGIYVTLSPYPMVPKEEVGFRIQLTAANTEAEIDHMISVIQELDQKIPMVKNQTTGTREQKPSTYAI